MQENIQEKYKTLKLTELREIAKSAGIKNTSALRKPQLIQLLCELEVQQQSHETSGAEKTENSKAETGNQRLEHAEHTERQERAEHQECTERAERHEHQERQKQERYENRNFEDLDSGQTANGILEVMADGFGFIRCENYLPGDNDVYVSPAQIRRFNLKTGDIVEGNLKIKTPTEKFSALLYVRRVNGLPPSEAVKRSNFEDMTPIFPNQRIRLETERSSVPMRSTTRFIRGNSPLRWNLDQPKTQLFCKSWFLLIIIFIIAFFGRLFKRWLFDQCAIAKARLFCDAVDTSKAGPATCLPPGRFSGGDKKRVHRSAELLCQPKSKRQGGVIFVVFNGVNRLAGHTAALGQLFLGKPQFFSACANGIFHINHQTFGGNRADAADKSPRQ